MKTKKETALESLGTFKDPVSEEYILKFAFLGPPTQEIKQEIKDKADAQLQEIYALIDATDPEDFPQLIETIVSTESTSLGWIFLKIMMGKVESRKTALFHSKAVHNWWKRRQKAHYMAVQINCPEMLGIAAKVFPE